MKSLTVSQLKKDKVHYEELLLQKERELEAARQQVVALQTGMIRLDGALTYVVNNLANLTADEKPGVYIEGQLMENMEYIPPEEK